jgi:TolA-binding protein
LAKLEEDLKAQAEALKAREDAIKQLRETMEAQQKTMPSDGLAEGAAAESDAIRRDYEAAWRTLDKKDYKAAIGRFRNLSRSIQRALRKCAILDW